MNKVFVFFVLGVGLSASSLCFSQEATELAPVRVFGSDRAVLSETMSSGVVSKDAIESQQLTDVNRALRQTPGVYIREEEGQGLRPNIGLRGTNPDRSKKVTLLEDGVLIGPAPYSAPAAYYTPSMNHIESLNIFKGFSAVGIGPNSIGGAVDYRTLSFPSELRTKIQSFYGSFDTWNTKLSHGSNTSFGSYLISGSYFESDGFKDLDGGGNTGFEKWDGIGKIRVDLPGSESKVHALELRFGLANEDSNETYLGLTREDFLQTPFRRYRASALDEMKWEFEQYQLRHEIQLSENAILDSAVYHHGFHRDWYRLDHFRDNSTPLYQVLQNANTGTNAIKAGILRGRLDSDQLPGSDGDLMIASNERTYFSRGVQTRLSTLIGTDGIEYKPWVFARFHQDQISRNHTLDAYRMTGGDLVRTADPSNLAAQNRESASAITAAVGGDIKRGSLTLTPVLRSESVRYEFENYLNMTANNNRNTNVFLPGVSLLKEWNGRFSTRASWNEAATIAGLSADGSEVREEASNYELEFRYLDQENIAEAMITFFYMDYRNLTGTCTASNGCESAQIGTAFDGGKALVQGAEVSLAKGFYIGEVFLPIQANVTLLQAEFNSSFISSAPEWGDGTIRDGDPLPYIPSLQYSVQFGLDWKNLRGDLIYTYQSKVYDQSVALNRMSVDAFDVFDFAARYRLSKALNLMFKADNLLAKEYAVAARPFGFRPGKPQSFQAGVVYEF